MIVCYELRQILSNIINLSQRLEQGNKLKEAAILRVIIPGEDGDRILWVEGVGSW